MPGTPQDKRGFPLLPALAGVGCALSLFAAAHAQEPGETQQENANQRLEEIVITRPRSRRQLYNEAGRATENFYALLNEVLDEPEFEITCTRETPINTRIARRVCRARYQVDEAARATQAMLAAGGIDDEGQLAETAAPYDPVIALRAKSSEFAAKMLVAVNTDPELNRAVMEMMALKAAITALDEE